MSKFTNCAILSFILSVVVVINAHHTPATDVLPHAPQCGVYSEIRILPGVIVNLAADPWIALLEYSKPNNIKGFHCAGNLISKRYVVTAAQCVSRKKLPRAWSLTSVRLGEYDLLKQVDCEYHADEVCNPPVVDMQISEKIIHELFDPESKSYTNDIALLRLQSDVEFSDAVQPICLPRDVKLRADNYENVRFIGAGWYKHTNEYSIKLWGPVNGVNSAECNQTYNTIGVSVQDTQFCAQSDYGFILCDALIGSPIMTINRIENGRNFFNFAGFVSQQTEGCGGQAWPVIFTRIDSYVEWIESKIYV